MEEEDVELASESLSLSLSLSLSGSAMPLLATADVSRGDSSCLIRLIWFLNVVVVVMMMKMV